MYLLYFVLWVIFNGQVTLEICLFGVVIAALILAFTCRFMDYSIERELRLYRRIGKLGSYVWLLICEIVKANLTVLHMILSEKEEPSPVLVEFDADLATPVGRAFMANAITLTPGTITVLLEGSSYLVHCLDESLAPGMADSEFTQRIRELEQDEIPAAINKKSMPQSAAADTASQMRKSTDVKKKSAGEKEAAREAGAAGGQKAAPKAESAAGDAKQTDSGSKTGKRSVQKKGAKRR